MSRSFTSQEDVPAPPDRSPGFYCDTPADELHDTTHDAPAETGFVRAPLAAQPVQESQLQAWIAGVTRQDQAALNALYQACTSRVYGLVLRITRNAELAEEVVEDTFWQVWRQAPRFDPARGTALAWILTMARSRALDALRARDPAMATEDVTALLDARSEQAIGPEDLLDAVQSGHRLHQALQQLEVQPRQLIALAFFRGLTHDEIATHTGVPLGTVKSHIRRGLNTLRTLLGAEAEAS
ncbi:sigma-70 family RNA polymerase sigma factor [Uliginosibacterium sp. H3]|uniref:Sigma-70 family RNA polymerase sigma factor n=1 Tax=Uliginosibacterium silvisoli TaxID=3114758 RepID=A0ABU6K710_9RHOO|nr:sigma-70 family RNA polymerase sigma factor [Uliginosibacterium sp. H3]